MPSLFELLFNKDGSINYENCQLYLPDMMNENYSEITKRTLVLDYVSEQTNIRPDILKRYLPDMMLEKVLLNNPLPIDVLIEHRHFIIDQLIRLLSFEHSDYIQRFIQEELVDDSPLLVMQSLCQHHSTPHVVLEYIFKEVYFGLYETFTNEHYPCRVDPNELLEYASEHMLCLFSTEFLFHHQHLFNSAKILAFHHDVDLFNSWMVEDWFDGNDVSKAIELLVAKSRQETDENKKIEYSRRIFMIQGILNRAKLA